MPSLAADPGARRSRARRLRSRGRAPAEPHRRGVSGRIRRRRVPRRRTAARSDEARDRAAGAARHSRGAAPHTGRGRRHDGDPRGGVAARHAVVKRYFFPIFARLASRTPRNSSPGTQFGIVGAFAASHPSQKPSCEICMASCPVPVGSNLVARLVVVLLAVLVRLLPSRTRPACRRRLCPRRPRTPGCRPCRG